MEARIYAKQENEIIFTLDIDKPWIMRLSAEDGIQFNSKDYPSYKEDDFSREIIEILEMTFKVKFIEN